MRIFTIAALALALASAGATPCRAEYTPEMKRLPKEPVWEAHLKGFTEADYDTAVERLIAAYEKASGHAIAPGAKKKVGLKIYSDSGPGMATPTALVKAVIASLERRGYQNNNIFLVGLNQLRLRMTGYLPSLVKRTQRGKLTTKQVGIDFEQIAQTIEREDAVVPAKVHPAPYFFEFSAPGLRFRTHAHHVTADRVFEDGEHQAPFAVNDAAARNQVIILLRHQRKHAIHFGALSFGIGPLARALGGIHLSVTLAFSLSFTMHRNRPR